MPKIQVKDSQTGQVLFECDLDEAERAYQVASQFDEMGLDVKVSHPTLSETLSSSLGLSKEDVKAYNESLEEELEQHDGSCCFDDGPDKKVH